MSKSAGILSLLAVGVLFGISGPLAKYLSTWLTSYQTVALRFGIAFLIASIISFFAKENFSIKKGSRRNAFYFAVVFPLSTIFFTLSVFNTKVSLAIFSFYIANLLTSFLLGRIIFKEKINLPKSISLVLIGIALICFTNPFENFSLNKGFVFGLVSGVLQTATSILQKRLAGVNRLGSSLDNSLIRQTISFV